jgi:hypothetical protein
MVGEPPTAGRLSGAKGYRWRQSASKLCQTTMPARCSCPGKPTLPSPTISSPSQSSPFRGHDPDTGCRSASGHLHVLDRGRRHDPAPQSGHRLRQASSTCPSARPGPMACGAHRPARCVRGSAGLVLILGRDYTEIQRQVELPPPCPRCGSRTVVPYWRETHPVSVEQVWTATAFRCMDCLGQ